jgi:hypothetical protein
LSCGRSTTPSSSVFFARTAGRRPRRDCCWARDRLAIRGRGRGPGHGFFDRPASQPTRRGGNPQGQIERSGFVVQLGAVAREILGAGDVRGLRFESGDEVEADAVVIAAGIAPEIGLAKDAGLKVGRGIVVDDRMRTSADGIFAAGDAAEHAGRIYGIIPAAFEQARVAAHNMLGWTCPTPTVPNTSHRRAYVIWSGTFGEGPAESVVWSDPGTGFTRRSPRGPARRRDLDGHEEGGPGDQPSVALNKDVERMKDICSAKPSILGIS